MKSRWFFKFAPAVWHPVFLWETLLEVPDVKLTLFLIQVYTKQAKTKASVRGLEELLSAKKSNKKGKENFFHPGRNEAMPNG